MGRYMRKCKGTEEEVAVMEVAEVRKASDDPREPLEIAVTKTKTKKRKVRDGELNQEHIMRKRSGSSVAVVTPELETLVSTPASSVDSRENAASTKPISSPNHLDDYALEDSCCSSNGSIEVMTINGSSKFIDLDEDSVETAVVSKCNSESADSRETTTLSSELQGDHQFSELDSMSKPQHDHLSTAEKKVPSEAEIDEFFAAAEKDLHKRFAEKYNFDIAKEEPLIGRYEWVRLRR